jgi:hypothetical protein
VSPLALPWRRVLPPSEPAGLLAESAQRTEAAEAATAPVVAYDMRPAKHPRTTDGWPDPYGPDPRVFGWYRKARREDADYQWPAETG